MAPTSLRILSSLLLSVGFAILLTLNSVFASFCGPSSIPFSFEALPNGQPVLGCARPTCFGWTADGRPASQPATFFRVNKKPDGYFRKSTADANAARPIVLSAENAPFFHVQTAQCAATFDAHRCPSEQNFWVGGIAPSTNISNGQPLSLQCCKYEALRLSLDRGIAVVNPGQIVFGGEVLNERRQYAFDYISDVVRNRRDDGTVSYDVSVRRIACLPYPPEMSVPVEAAATEEIIRRFGNAKKEQRPKALQAPTVVGNGIVDANVPTSGVGGEVVGISERTLLVPTGEERVELIEGPFIAETNAQVEEVQALEGLELPPGQVPQGLVEAPAQPAAPVYDSAPAYGFARGGGGGGGGGFYCFSADTQVQMADGSAKRMDELSVDDWVLTESENKPVYSVVKSWVHRKDDELAEFYKIELENGQLLKLTGKHYIYKTVCSGAETTPVKIAQRPVYAEEVAVGDCLYASDSDTYFVERRVRSIERVTERGIYSPMTANGRIVVNGVLASCYNVVHSATMQETFFAYVKQFQSMPILNHFFGAAAANGEKRTMDLPIGITLLANLMEHVLPAGVYSSSSKY